MITCRGQFTKIKFTKNDSSRAMFNDPLQRPNPRPLRLVIAVFTVLLVFLAAFPLIHSGLMLGRPGFDQLNYHERAIRIFAHDWPHLDFKNYLSATTPGYHLVLAAICGMVSSSSFALQLTGHLFTSFLIGVLAWACARKAHPALALSAVIAFACSQYVFAPAVWLLPDNAGWLFAMLVLLASLTDRLGLGAAIIGAVSLWVLVLTRQVHLWVLAPFAISLLWPREPIHGEMGVGTGARPPPLMRRIVILVIAAAGAAGLLAHFMRLWHGLTPPLFQTQYAPPAGALPFNLAAPAFVLAVFGLFAPFFALSWLPALRLLRRSNRAVVIGVVAMILLITLIPTTSFSANVDDGRWNGLWMIGDKLFPPPPIALDAPAAGPLTQIRQSLQPILTLHGHTNPVIVALALLGALAVCGLLSRQSVRNAGIFAAAIGAFVATQMVTYQLWQRYTEPFVLMLLALLACLASSRLALRPSFVEGPRWKPSDPQSSRWLWRW
jgi:hypothetical protein